MVLRIAAAGFACALIAAGRADIGAEVSQQVNVADYQFVLDEVLYTKPGDSRGISGPEHDLCRDAIAQAFASHGLQVELQEFTWQNFAAENVIGTKVGSLYPESMFVVGAHYDSVSNPGADDDASGVAGLIELARVFATVDTAYSIRFIAFDLEEVGLIGSKRYVEAHLTDDIRGMIQMDMIARRSDALHCRVYGKYESDDWKIALAQAITQYGGGMSVQLYGPLDVSDHAPFEAAGFTAAWVTEDDFAINPCWHKECDHTENAGLIDYDYAASIVKGIAGLLAHRAEAAPLADCAADLDGNGTVDGLDLSSLLSVYGLCEGDPGWNPDADLAPGDRVPCIDQSDLSALLAAFGTGCG